MSSYGNLPYVSPLFARYDAVGNMLTQTECLDNLLIRSEHTFEHNEKRFKECFDSFPGWITELSKRELISLVKKFIVTLTSLEQMGIEAQQKVIKDPKQVSENNNIIQGILLYVDIRIKAIQRLKSICQVFIDSPIVSKFQPSKSQPPSKFQLERRHSIHSMSPTKKPKIIYTVFDLDKIIETLQKEHQFRPKRRRSIATSTPTKRPGADTHYSRHEMHHRHRKDEKHNQDKQDTQNPCKIQRKLSFAAKPNSPPQTPLTTSPALVFHSEPEGRPNTGDGLGKENVAPSRRALTRINSVNGINQFGSRRRKMSNNFSIGKTAELRARAKAAEAARAAGKAPAPTGTDGKNKDEAIKIDGWDALQLSLKQELQRSVEDLKSKYEKEMEAMRSTNTVLQHQLTQERTKSSSQEELINSLRNRLLQLESTVKQNEQHKEELQHSLQQKREELQTLMQEKETMQATHKTHLAEAHTAKQAHQDKIAAMTSEAQESKEIFDKKIKEQEDKIKEHIESIDLLAEELGKVEGELTKAHQTKGEMRFLIQQLIADNKRLNENVDALRAERRQRSGSLPGTLAGFDSFREQQKGGDDFKKGTPSAPGSRSGSPLRVPASSPKDAATNGVSGSGPAGQAQKPTPNGTAAGPATPAVPGQSSQTSKAKVAGVNKKP